MHNTIKMVSLVPIGSMSKERTGTRRKPAENILPKTSY